MGGLTLLMEFLGSSQKLARTILDGALMTPEFFGKITGSAFGPGRTGIADVTSSIMTQRQVFLRSCQSAIKTLRSELPNLKNDALRNGGDFYVSTRARLEALIKTELRNSQALRAAPQELLSKTGFQQDWAVSEYSKEFMKQLMNSLLRGRV
ncbi:MAG: hypothetical protein NTW15_12380 [Burkholderiales bacterium]|nr:hypothetical protein [Burkholderiales bacterium]